MPQYNLYQLLGFITAPYAGTFDPASQQLTMITLLGENDLIGQQNVDYFQVLCQRFFRELQLQPDLKLEYQQRQNYRFARFTSKTISDYLASFIANQDIKNAFLPVYGVDIQQRLLAQQQRLAYLVGAYYVHSVYMNMNKALNAHVREQANWLFSNNYDKVLFVHQLMVDLADEDDTICLSSRFLTPHSHRIVLNNDGPLWHRLQQFINELQ